MRGVSWLLIIIILVGTVLTVGAAGFTYVNVKQLAADSPLPLPAPPQFGGSKATTVPLFVANPTAVPTTQGVGTQAANTVNAVATQAIPTYNNPTRVTILLMGIDQRKGEKGPFRTDTMIVLSIDPIRKTAAMLSIPRDIYLPIPGYNKADHINNAEAIGEIIQYPGGGPELAVKTIESLIGVPIQRYVLINFDVFDTVINAIGPIQVCPPTPIHDDNYPDGSYGIITVDFPAGCQNLDAVKLLEYSRVRHNAGDDFGRQTRQQEVIRSVRDKVLTLGGASALIGQAGGIWNSVKDSVKTDMTFEEMIQLAQLAQGIPKENIQSSTMTDKGGYLQPVTLADGSQVFSPVYEKIHDLMSNLFDATAGAPVVNDQASGEGAKILVSNGTQVSGLAKATSDQLKLKGFLIADAKTADSSYGKSLIRVYTGKIKTARYLAQTLGIDGTMISAEKNGPAGVDIELIIGDDLSAQLSTTPQP